MLGEGELLCPFWPYYLYGRTCCPAVVSISNIYRDYQELEPCCVICAFLNNKRSQMIKYDNLLELTQLF